MLCFLIPNTLPSSSLQLLQFSEFQVQAQCAMSVLPFSSLFSLYPLHFDPPSIYIALLYTSWLMCVIFKTSKIWVCEKTGDSCHLESDLLCLNLKFKLQVTQFPSFFFSGIKRHCRHVQHFLLSSYGIQFGFISWLLWIVHKKHGCAFIFVMCLDFFDVYLGLL